MTHLYIDLDNTWYYPIFDLFSVHILQCESLEYFSFDFNFGGDEFKKFIPIIRHSNLKSIKLEKFTLLNCMVPYLTNIFDSNLSHFSFAPYNKIQSSSSSPSPTYSHYFDNMRPFNDDSTNLFNICYFFYEYYNTPNTHYKHDIKIIRKFRELVNHINNEWRTFQAVLK